LCDLVLCDSQVSRRHAALERNGRGYVLHDLRSSNGTYVNGERITQIELRGCEQIQLGNTVLASSLDDPSSPGGATVLGSALVARGLALSQSAIHRLTLERSLRRVTVIAGAAFAFAAVASALLATGVVAAGGEGEGESEAVQRVVREAARSTLLLEVQRDGTRVRSGTAWVLDAAGGLVVTNAHVINGGLRFRVGAGDQRREATVVGVAPCDDLAVLRLADAHDLRALALGDQSALEQGETVVAIGYPMNASQEDNLASTTGVVSVVRSAYRERALDVPRYPNVVQTDAAINPGNSGGPLLDLDGRLVGVTSAGRTLASDGRLIQGQSYAIGVDRVEEVTTILRTGRSVGWSGLGFEYQTREKLHYAQLPIGLPITRALPDTGAAAAGLGERRAVLVAVNGMPVGTSLAGYCDAVAGFASGETVIFSVYEPDRGRTREVPLRLE
jgi:S1-C subfamily serine protease